MTALTKLLAYNCLTGEATGSVELRGRNLICSDRALEQTVAHKADRHGWTPEQAMNGLNGHVTGYTVFLPEGARPPGPR
ncbi:hypothetical protein GCM10009555_105850 [Acrocarpospora macrocephala]|uniref:Uncharacterized protein n=1 Tax=Acrocarpospora macrocephala TaxID=150177 RepID=A0A5M3WZ08_9ACTN|nr:hypothetical protein Amac_072530 [Acrocarpospora macrocephala]